MLQAMLEVAVPNSSSWLFTDLRADLERVVDRATIVVLDEADELPDTRMVHHLTGIPKLSLVAIWHDAAEQWNRLDETHRHRFEASTQSAFETLYTQQAEIESKIGARLEWETPTKTSSGRQRSQITATHEENIFTQDQQWKEY